MCRLTRYQQEEKVPSHSGALFYWKAWSTGLDTTDAKPRCQKQHMVHWLQIFVLITVVGVSSIYEHWAPRVLLKCFCRLCWNNLFWLNLLTPFSDEKRLLFENLDQRIKFQIKEKCESALIQNQREKNSRRSSKLLPQKASFRKDCDCTNVFLQFVPKLWHSVFANLETVIRICKFENCLSAFVLCVFAKPNSAQLKPNEPSF